VPEKGDQEAFDARRGEGVFETGPELFTEAPNAYTGLDADYLHQEVDHAVTYVEGNVLTNGLENF
jgi:hypothetical protein